jgi:hypothetical protein
MIVTFEPEKSQTELLHKLAVRSIVRVASVSGAMMPSAAEVPGRP